MLMFASQLLLTVYENMDKNKKAKNSLKNDPDCNIPEISRLNTISYVEKSLSFLDYPHRSPVCVLF